MDFMYGSPLLYMSIEINIFFVSFNSIKDDTG